ncbi:MAG TPA: hypothetical protein PLS69_01755 [Terricaulis sp.]|nr:hypothetical protein [Terricaulis sp.]
MSPPARAPYYFDNEQHGWPIADCARMLMDDLARFAKPARDFRGDAHGRIWCAALDEASAPGVYVRQRRWACRAPRA